MDWVALITTILPLILQIINKPTDTPEQKAEICTQVERHVWPWIAAGIVKPVIDRVMPLTNAAEAHRALEAGEVTGKVVLRR